MLEITTAQLNYWLTAFMWPFIRVLAFIAAAPVFRHSSMPRIPQIGIAALFTIAIVPSLPPLPNVPFISYAGIWLVVQQILIGVSLGFVVRLVFSAIQMAASFISFQMGLSFATFFSPDSGGSTMVLARFFDLIALMLFLALNGHLYMLEVLANTFTLLPIGATALNASAWNTIAMWGSLLFSAGLLLALPLITALLITNLAMGILNRAAPQLTIFSIGFPMTLLFGVVLITFLLPEMGGIFEQLFKQGLDMMAELARTLGAP
ncbi:flagellar biosynthetic protein FliR [Larsenimonas suaedae]|uniref:Flagellar biosynthetic protein FliR n=1 Tax=Larsenimonas suaedae TaxID=1851019 RepID=A0ABU1GUW7_9GAMM|nr:flagellar biosynthetic protein FliR [Larsenimonas suaedae]MCM2971616.1 flagellar biosynthetic protein FliR [Larsenimonas suaedae]MDR5895168.1 flagellar biosynthetic protein FliR [Larsenimonas suaedae]